MPGTEQGPPLSAHGGALGQVPATVLLEPQHRAGQAPEADRDADGAAVAQGGPEQCSHLKKIATRQYLKVTTIFLVQKNLNQENLIELVCICVKPNLHYYESQLTEMNQSVMHIRREFPAGFSLAAAKRFWGLDCANIITDCHEEFTLLMIT